MKTKILYKNTIKFFLFAILGLLLSTSAVAQGGKKTGTFNLLVKGSSNLHDWTMKAAGSGIDANFTMNPGVAHLAGIPSLSFTMPVKNLKSNESLMDSRAYSALKADKNPNISFKVVSATTSAVQQNKSQLNVTGMLTIAGVSRQVTLAGSSVANTDGSVVVNGSKTIKMSEFGVKPPSFMLGALKVYDDVTIEYSARFK